MAGSNEIAVGPTTIENLYPEKITFHVSATSPDVAIDTVDLYLNVRGDLSTSVLRAEFTPGTTVEATVNWMTRENGIPPGAPVTYAWRFQDRDGRVLMTEPVEYTVVDPRFEWSTLEDDRLAVWWYAGGDELGRRVFDTAGIALDNMSQATHIQIPHRLQVVLYANDEDFESWHERVESWVAGQAYTEMSLTVQVVGPGGRESWIRDVIPHEVAHLFFYQATHTALAADPPSWLNEGFATYQEFRSHDDEMDQVRWDVRQGELIPLRLISGSFTGDDDRIDRLYNESLSAVTFLYERWGAAGVGRLMESYRQGHDTDEALLEVTGLTFEEFQEAWWVWLDGPAGAYPTAPAYSAPTPRPTEIRPTLPPGATVTAIVPRTRDVLAPAGASALVLALCCAVWLAALGALSASIRWLTRRNPRRPSSPAGPPSPDVTASSTPG